MPKIYSDVSQIRSINKKIVDYIRYRKPLPIGAKIKYVWSHGQTHSPAARYAGQIEYSKILPNGNKQTRLVTAYGGGDIGMTTIVKSPDGEVLKAYAGVRCRSWKAISPDTGKVTEKNTGTIAYTSGGKYDVLGDIIRGKIFTGNPRADENNIHLLLKKD